jgi:transposase
MARTRRGYWSQCCSAFRGVTGGSLYHHCRLPLRSWFYVALLMADLPMGVSVAFIARQLGITHKAAWRMINALRVHMAALETPRRVGGPGRRVYCDETRLRVAGRPVSLFGLTDGENLVVKIVPDRSRKSLFPIIEQSVVAGSVIVTDNYSTYRSLDVMGWHHRRINHSTNGWMNAEGDCNAPIERVWSSLKRQLLGATGQIEDAQLWKFIKDFLFRYHARATPHEMFWRLVSSYPPKERYDQAVLRAEVDAREYPVTERRPAMSAMS